MDKRDGKFMAIRYMAAGKDVCDLRYMNQTSVYEPYVHLTKLTLGFLLWLLIKAWYVSVMECKKHLEENLNYLTY